MSLDGRPGGRLRIVVWNPAPPPAASEPPASTRGHGLAGIAERAHAVDGALDVSRRDGQHIVEAVLPWTA